MNDFSLTVDNQPLFENFIYLDVPSESDFSEDERENIKSKYAKVEEKYHSCVVVLRHLLNQTEDLMQSMSEIGDAIFRLGGWIKHI